MKLLIGQSYYLRFDEKMWTAMQPYPPLGPLCAASLLEQHQFDLAFFDAMLAPSEAAWEQALEAHRPTVAILYEDNFNYFTKMCLSRMRQAAFEMIRAARAKSCRVIVCGSDASDHPDVYLEEGAEFVIKGEGEYTLLELLEVIDGRHQRPLDEVAGLVFLRDGRQVSTAPRPVIKDLDALPYAAWHFVDVDRYRDAWLERHGYFALNMVTSRGCPFHCNWCAKPIWGQRYHARSPEHVIGELSFLKQTCAPDRIWMMDDIMGIKPGWMNRFADLVEQHGVRIPFKCLNRADLLLRDGEIDALRRAGCEIVWTGVESGSQKILDAMEKGITVEQVKEASARLHEAGIGIGFFLQFGYPGETMEDIEATIQLVRQCRPDDIGISVSYPLPGTRFYEAVEHQLGKKQQWIHSHDLEMLYRGPFTSAFYRKLHTVVHKDFRMRKAAKETLKGLLNPRKLSRRHIHAFSSSLYHSLTLPMERYRLSRLSRARHVGVDPFAQHMNVEAAATPTPF